MRSIIMVVAGICFLLAGTSFAFHDAGVAECAGCHTMHNSEDGALVDPNSPLGNPWLLKDATPSDVCLRCHETGSRGVFQTDPLNPSAEKGAGNFIFLTEDNMNDGHGGGDTLADGSWEDPIPGYKAGHNVIAPGFGLYEDPTPGMLNGPGGNYPKSMLGCSSCHDPHGNENFRLLYGAGPVNAGLYNFANAAPSADGINLRSAVEGPAMHTAYKGGMSAWCGNCHNGMHTPGSRLIHKSGVAIGATMATFYGLYNGTTNFVNGVNGDPTLSYIPEVAFEDAGMTITSTAGPSASSQVSCITCHRAHASGAPNAGRWDFNVTLLAEDGDEAGSYKIPQPYDANQRSLCNKCHGKDANDHLPF